MLTCKAVIVQVERLQRLKAADGGGQRCAYASVSAELVLRKCSPLSLFLNRLSSVSALKLPIEEGSAVYTTISARLVLRKQVLRAGQGADFYEARYFTYAHLQAMHCLAEVFSPLLALVCSA